jgi:molecular chaperone GrpE (heat shock protein)
VWEAHVGKLHDSRDAHIKFHRQEAAMWKSTAQGHKRIITQLRAELAEANQNLASLKETHLREKAEFVSVKVGLEREVRMAREEINSLKA